MDPRLPSASPAPLATGWAFAITTENTVKRFVLRVLFPLGWAKPAFQGCLDLESNQLPSTSNILGKQNFLGMETCNLPEFIGFPASPRPSFPASSPGNV